MIGFLKRLFPVLLVFANSCSNLPEPKSPARPYLTAVC